MSEWRGKFYTHIICIFISPDTGSQKQPKINKNKYTARELKTAVATLRKHNGNRHDIDKNRTASVS